MILKLLSIGIVIISYTHATARNLLALDNTDLSGKFHSSTTLDIQNIDDCECTKSHNDWCYVKSKECNLDRHCQMLPTRLPLSTKAPTHLTWPYKYHYKPKNLEFNYKFYKNSNKIELENDNDRFFKGINVYCDKHKISFGDLTEYWSDFISVNSMLDIFTNICNIVLKVTDCQVGFPDQKQTAYLTINICTYYNYITIKNIHNYYQVLHLKYKSDTENYIYLTNLNISLALNKVFFTYLQTDSLLCGNNYYMH